MAEIPQNVEGNSYYSVFCAEFDGIIMMTS